MMTHKYKKRKIHADRERFVEENKLQTLKYSLCFKRRQRLNMISAHQREIVVIILNIFPSLEYEKSMISLMIIFVPVVNVSKNFNYSN